MASNEALVDASAFLEIDKAFAEQTLDGVELAIQEASKPANANPPAVATRINQQSLDRIATAFQEKKMMTFGTLRDDVDTTLRRIREEQVTIFHKHMLLDIVENVDVEKADVDFSNKDFLDRFQTAHLAKEKEMTVITRSLDNLSKSLSELNSKLESNLSIPSDPLVTEEKATGPRMSLKQAAMMLRKSKVMHATQFKDAVEDMVIQNRITHGGNHFPVSHASTEEPSDSLLNSSLDSSLDDAAHQTPDKVQSAPTTPKIERRPPPLNTSGSTAAQEM